MWDLKKMSKLQHSTLLWLEPSHCWNFAAEEIINKHYMMCSMYFLNTFLQSDHSLDKNFIRHHFFSSGVRDRSQRGVLLLTVNVKYMKRNVITRSITKSLCWKARAIRCSISRCLNCTYLARYLTASQFSTTALQFSVK
jgi:hypothetical protein